MNLQEELKQARVARVFSGIVFFVAIWWGDRAQVVSSDRARTTHGRILGTSGRRRAARRPTCEFGTPGQAAGIWGKRRAPCSRTQWTIAGRLRHARLSITTAPPDSCTSVP